MKAIFGLGNPGKEYENTRHNTGFRIVDYINKKYGGSFGFDKKSESEISEVKINGKKFLLAKPQIFVNKSGKAVEKLIKRFKFQQRFRNEPQAARRNLRRAVSSLIVIHDDLDIPFGKVKLSFGRSSAGHKGGESIIRALKTDKFYRIRIGTFNQQIVRIRKIKDKRKRLREMNKFVISPFGGSEKNKLNRIIKESAQKLIDFL